jgi:hypothetical protein
MWGGEAGRRDGDGARQHHGERRGDRRGQPLLPAVAVGATSGEAIRRYVESSDADNEKVVLSFAGTAVDV